MGRAGLRRVGFRRSFADHSASPRAANPRGGAPSRNQENGHSASSSTMASLVDFHALGLRPHECRMTVIRRAAERNCCVLAQRQLKSPSRRTELQLWRVAISAYRLMDPRKRAEVHEGAHLGRILPLALQSAGRTSFAAGRSASDTPTIDPSEPSPAKQVQLSETTAPRQVAFDPDYSRNELQSEDLDEPLVSLAHGMELENGFGDSLSSDDLLRQSWLNQSYWRLTLSSTPLRMAITIAAAALIVAGLFGYSRYSDRVETDLIAKNQTSSVGDPNKGSSSNVKEALAERKSSKPVTQATVDDDVPVGPDRLLVSPPSKEESKSQVSSNAVTDTSSSPTVGSPELVLEESSDDEKPIASNSMPSLDTEATSAANDAQGMLSEEIKATVASSSEPPKGDSSFLEDPFDTMMNQVALAPTTDAPQRKVIPDKAAESKITKRLRELVPALNRSLTKDQVEPILLSLHELTETYASDSPDAWYMRVTAAKVAWITKDVEDVYEILAPLQEVFDARIESTLTDSFVDSLPFRETSESHAHRLEQGIRLYDHLLLNEEFELADQVEVALQASADFVDDADYRETIRDFRLANEQMVRLKSNATALIDQPIANLDGIDVDVQAYTSSQLGIAGRYACLLQRRWEMGLEWMAGGNDARYAPLAKQEIRLDDSSSSDDRMEVAERWLALSRRSSGRTAESIMLHSLAVFKSAVPSASGVQKIELERVIADIEFKLPWYLAHPVHDSASSH